MNLGRLCERCGQVLHSTIFLGRRASPPLVAMRRWQCPSLHEVWLVDASPIGAPPAPVSPPSTPPAPRATQGSLFA